MILLSSSSFGICSACHVDLGYSVDFCLGTDWCIYVRCACVKESIKCETNLSLIQATLFLSYSFLGCLGESGDGVACQRHCVDKSETHWKYFATMSLLSYSIAPVWHRLRIAHTHTHTHTSKSCKRQFLAPFFLFLSFFSITFLSITRAMVRAQSTFYWSIWAILIDELYIFPYEKVSMSDRKKSTETGSRLGLRTSFSSLLSLTLSPVSFIVTVSARHRFSSESHFMVKLIRLNRRINTFNNCDTSHVPFVPVSIDGNKVPATFRVRHTNNWH